MGPRAWAAEAAGTGLLMLGGLSAIAVVLGAGSFVHDALPSQGVRLLSVGLLFASCVAAIAVSPLGRVSGAHLNPAVTVAFRVMGGIAWRDVAGYVAAQLAGATVGALAFRAVWGSLALSVDGGITRPAVAVWLALLLEAAMTAALVATIFAFGARERLMRWTPLAIVPVITVLVWAAAPYTGTSLNPARSEGPAVAFGRLGDLWLYLVAPTAGAVALASVWRLAGRERCPKTVKLYPVDELRAGLPAE